MNKLKRKYQLDEKNKTFDVNLNILNKFTKITGRKMFIVDNYVFCKNWIDTNCFDNNLYENDMKILSLLKEEYEKSTMNKI